MGVDCLVISYKMISDAPLEQPGASRKGDFSYFNILYCAL